MCSVTLKTGRLSAMAVRAIKGKIKLEEFIPPRAKECAHAHARIRKRRALEALISIISRYVDSSKFARNVPSDQPGAGFHRRKIYPRSSDKNSHYTSGDV